MSTKRRHSWTLADFGGAITYGEGLGDYRKPTIPDGRTDFFAELRSHIDFVDSVCVGLNIPKLWTSLECGRRWC